jgi:hypothetical protein
MLILCVFVGWPVYFCWFALYNVFDGTCVLLSIGLVFCCWLAVRNCYSLAVFIVVVWDVLFLVGLCIVFGWPCVLLLVDCVYCCWLTVCNTYRLAMYIVVLWHVYFCWLAVGISVGWPCVLLSFSRV